MKFLSYIRFIPHILAFLLFKSRVKIDLLQWQNVISGTPNHGSNLLTFLWLLDNIREYRSLVYYRLGVVGKVLGCFASPMPTCFLTDTLSRNIGAGLVIQHGHSMRLCAKRIGKNLQIWHNVTVGKSKPGGDLPTIGDNVRIFTGSVVLGDITIGDNVTIGACTLVLKSVPDNCVVVGNPARIVSRDGKKCNIPL